MKIGIDLGGSHIAVGIVTEQGKSIAKKEENINFMKYNKETLKPFIRGRIQSLMNVVLKELQIPIFTVKTIGIGVPGIIQENKIQTCTKYHIFHWDLAKELEEQYHIPVKIQNDAICAAKAEKKYGNLQEVKKAVFLCLGTGIGGATIVEDTILPSEYGHLILQEGGRKCHCGKKGCFETYSSMKAFKNGLIEKLQLKETTSSEQLLEILEKQSNKGEINTYLEEYLDTLLAGIVTIIKMVKPELICLGGSFVYFEKFLYHRLQEKALEKKQEIGEIKFTLAKLGNTAGIIGATLE